jgi:hypothetical protein
MKNTSTSKIKEQIELMQTCCINLATGKHADYEDYESLRAEITSKPLIAKNLPDWLLECRYGSQYWSFIKSKSDTYQGRREFLWGEFGKLLDHIERIGVDPTSLSIDEILKHFNTDSVLEAWEKCFIRRVSDPEGAITAARTLLESTCKHILENLGETPDSSGDLPKLYKQTSMVINPTTKLKIIYY